MDDQRDPHLEADNKLIADQKIRLRRILSRENGVYGKFAPDVNNTMYASLDIDEGHSEYAHLRDHQIEAFRQLRKLSGLYHVITADQSRAKAMFDLEAAERTSLKIATDALRIGVGGRLLSLEFKTFVNSTDLADRKPAKPRKDWWNTNNRKRWSK